MALPLGIHFTDPASPIFIDIEGDNSETLCVISTSQLGANASAPSQAHSTTERNSASRKRVREEDNDNGNGNENENENHNHNRNEEDPNVRVSVPRSRPADKERAKRPMKAVQRADLTFLAHAQAHASTSSRSGTVRGSMPPPASIPFRPLSQTPIFSQNNNDRDPLFLPGSQLSVAEEEAIRDSGLGIESMGAEELEALLEGDGEEVAFDFGSQRIMSQDGSGGLNDGAYRDEGNAMDDEGQGAGDSFDIIEDMELEATQVEGGKVYIFCLSDLCLPGIF